MKVIIAGGRDFNDYPLLYKKCSEILKNQSEIEIVNGLARGADSLGGKFAKEKGYKTTSLENFGAVTITNESKYRHYVVAFTDKDHLSNIAHEVVHIKNNIYLDCAMQADRHNDEPEAYLVGWLFEKIFEVLHN